VASSAPEDRPKGEILKANVDDAQPAIREEAPRRNVAVLPLVLGGVLLFVLGVGAALLLSPLTRPQSVSTAAPARSTSVAAPVPGGASAAAGSGALPDINGISCDTLEATIVHIHMHLAIFVNGQEQQIPYGIGIGQPWQVSDSDEGPFVDDGSCFYWIHTHTGDGIVHIESPLRRRFTLGDFFAIWQMPLSANQVGPAQGPVTLYVNGQQSTANPADVPLLAHERVQLDVGGDVPPYQFDFPDGD
jgi:hypothetical protein